MGTCTLERSVQAGNLIPSMFTADMSITSCALYKQCFSLPSHSTVDVIQQVVEEKWLSIFTSIGTCAIVVWYTSLYNA